MIRGIVVLLLFGVMNIRPIFKTNLFFYCVWMFVLQAIERRLVRRNVIKNAFLRDEAIRAYALIDIRSYSFAYLESKKKCAILFVILFMV